MPSARLSLALTTEAHDARPAHVLDRVAGGLLVLLALLLPFEAPLFRFGPLQMTSVELVLYAVIAAWALVLAKGWTRRSPTRLVAAETWRGDPMVQASVGWIVVTFAAASSATSFRAASLKFALRSTSGVLVFFAARTLARSPATRRRVIWALVAGALVSATTAALEGHAPALSSVWSVFRDSQFDTLGLARASGVFAYPTIGAMYWEAAVPLVIVAPLLERSARSQARGFRLSFVLLGSALLVGALLASATRSGVAGAAAANASLLALGWRSARSVRTPAIGALGVILAFSAVAMGAPGSGSPLAQRLRWWHDGEWLRAAYQVDVTPRRLRLGESFVVPMTVRNTGTVTWPRAGARPVHLGYHWERADGPNTLADYEGDRTPLPADVPPGTEVHLVGHGHAPSREGAYLLRWDLAQEGVTWFGDRGNAMPLQSVEVRGDLDSGTPLLPSLENEVGRPAVAAQPPTRLALWRAAVVLWKDHPWLGIGPDNFRRRYQAVLSPAPRGQPYTDTRIHANSLYFETLADLGLAGLLALAWLGWALARAVFRHGRSGQLSSLGCGVAAAAFFVHGAFDYFLEFTPLFGLFWLLLGLIAFDEPPPSAEAPRDSPPSVPAR